METIELKADIRTSTGKKGTKACRREGLLPGILYGKGAESTPVAVDPKQLDKVLHTHSGSNVIIKLTVEAKGADAVNVVVKDLQVDSIKGTMRHVDFCQISLDEKIRSMIPVKIVGESPGVKQGGVLERTLWELEVECLPMDIPDFVEVDVSELEIGDSLSVSSVNVPQGVTVLADWDATVTHISAPRAEEVVEAAPEEEIEGAEPGVIGAETEKEAEGAEKKSKATEDK